MKIFKFCVLLLILNLFRPDNVLAGDLRFRSDGKFKIIQITDSHIQANSPYSQETIEMLNLVLDVEKPDLVIFTGDIVTGKPYKSGFDMVIEPLISRKIPYALLFGNHDDEQDLSRKEVADLLMGYPYNVSKLKKVKNVSGYGNYTIEIKENSGKQTRAVIYCMDSNAYSTLKQVKGYGWFNFDQVEWYRKQSDRFTRKNDGKPFPALAFFHIPLPEYKKVYTDTIHRLVGTQMEKVCSPEINTGLFASMLEKGDVMGTFVGHDHVNDYIFNLYGIALAYGRFSGSKTTYTKLKNGVRVIELTEDTRRFDTWIRLDDKTVIDRIQFPDDLPLPESK
ncbi:MAG: metallophosphoesterase family protein [Dysgonamonadaceae bacterium]|jgi:predicted phosphodiesterase|nr:metallophosphoesterase family protein [Dysgonamonadaceae bacterium]